MRKYEGLFTFHPEIEEDNLKAKVEEVKKYITSKKGKVENINENGRVNLAYPIKKCKEGINVTFNLEMPAETVDIFKKKFTKDEKILRYFILRK